VFRRHIGHYLSFFLRSSAGADLVDILGRFTRGLESNWPLVYYFMVVVPEGLRGRLESLLGVLAVVCG
jgi:hypothetical protein